MARGSEEATIPQQTTAILISLIAYKLILIGIGLWASRRVHDEADFLLGGRNLGPWVAGSSDGVFCLQQQKMKLPTSWL